MFSGLFNPTLSRIEYKNVNDFNEKFNEEVPNIVQSLLGSIERRREELKKIKDAYPKLGKNVLKMRIVKKVKVNELAKLTDIEESWLVLLETYDYMAASMSIMILLRIAKEIDVDIMQCQKTGPELIWPNDYTMEDDAKESLDNLASFVLKKEHKVDEGKIFLMWESYYEEQSEEKLIENKAARHDRREILKVEDWETRYNQLVS